MKKALKHLLKQVPGFKSLDGYLYRRYRAYDQEPFPRGHFYSPLPDLDFVQSHAERLFRRDHDAIPGIDLREASQWHLLQELAAQYESMEWPEQRSAERRYYVNNIMFGFGSAFSLCAMMRRFQPRRIIEVGSGFSSAVMLDTNQLFCNDRVGFTFIEPFNERLLSLLRDADKERCTIIKDAVQNVPLSTFEELQANDFLFVDSSHVSKVGSDVNFIFSYVLPALQSGVIVHFHDIYWPFEYPQGWIVNNRWAWNEAYFLRAFLQYNEQFQILQFNNFLAYRFSEFIKQALPKVFAAPGSSFWMRKV